MGESSTERAERKIRNLERAEFQRDRAAANDVTGPQENLSREKYIKPSVGDLNKAYIKLVNILYSKTAKGIQISEKWVLIYIKLFILI